MKRLTTVVIMCVFFLKLPSNLLSFRIKQRHQAIVQWRHRTAETIQSQENKATTTSTDWISSFCENFFLLGAAQKDYLKCANRRYQLENNGLRMPQFKYDELKSTLCPSVLLPQDNNTINTIVFPVILENTQSKYDHSPLSFKNSNEKRLQFNTTLIPSTVLPSSFSGYLASPFHSYDCVIMSHYLSQLSTPEQRMEWFHQARHNLVNPGSFSPHPHRVGLFIIIENSDEFNTTGSSITSSSSGSIRSNNNNTKDSRSSLSSTPTSTATVHDLLNDWRQSVKKCGFELVKQRTLLVDDVLPDKGVTGRGCSGTVDIDINRELQTLQVFVFKTSNGTASSSIGSISSSKHKPWLARDFKVSSSPPSSSSLSSTVISKSNKRSLAFTTGSNIDLSQQLDISSSSSSVDNLKRDFSQPISSLPVGIVGGGLGGTALALALQRRNIPVKVYEKDQSFAHRKQGYALTIQQGAIALRMLGVMEEVANQGCLSLAHVSLTATGNVIGAYGVKEKIKNNDDINDQEVDNQVNTHNHENHINNNNNSNDNNINNTNTKIIHNVRTVSADVYIHLNSTSQIINKQATLNRDPLKRHNIHIPRQILREIMMKQIHPSIIQWNKKFQSFSEEKDKVIINFDDGSIEYVSILIAADGIHSLIRKQLDKQQQQRQHQQQKHISSSASNVLEALETSMMISNDSHQLNYLGLIVILGISNTIVLCDNIASSSSSSSSSHNNNADNANVVDPVIKSGRYQVQWVDGTTRVFTMPYDNTNTMWQLSFPVSEADAIAVTNQASVLKQLALNRLKGWHQPLVEMVKATQEDCISGHPAYDRHPHQIYNDVTAATSSFTTIAADDLINDINGDADIKATPQSSRVTLLGDSAHPMSPFKGQGANQALLDSLALSKAIIFSDLVHPKRRSVTEALREYEKEMWERSEIKVLKSRYAAVYLHSDVALAEGNITRAAAAEMANIKTSLTS